MGADSFCDVWPSCERSGRNNAMEQTTLQHDNRSHVGQIETIKEAVYAGTDISCH